MTGAATVGNQLANDPANSSERVCETAYFAMQDANFNVMGLADATGGGAMVERYEYTPYGQRTVYHPWARMMGRATRPGR